MPTYLYTIKDPHGIVQHGHQQATSEAMLSRHLQSLGYIVAQIDAIPSAPRDLSLWLRPVNDRDLSTLCMQMSTMLAGNLTVEECLSIAIDLTSHTKLRCTLEALRTDVRCGSTLTAAMAKHPSVFNPFFVTMVGGGECSGVLSEVLHRLATNYAVNQSTHRRNSTNNSYSIGVVVIAFSLTVWYSVDVLPRFLHLYRDMGIKDFPQITQWLVSLSSFLTATWPVLLGVLVSCCSLYTWWRRTPLGIKLLGSMIWKLPVLGTIVRKSSISRFSRALGMLLISGVPLAKALQTSAWAAQNDVVSRSVLKSAASIQSGKGIAQSFQEASCFPRTVINMLCVGEQYSSLDLTLYDIAATYEQESEDLIAKYSTIVEISLFVLVGVMFFIMVLALFMPMMCPVQPLEPAGNDN